MSTTALRASTSEGEFRSALYSQSSTAEILLQRMRLLVPASKLSLTHTFRLRAQMAGARTFYRAGHV